MGTSGVVEGWADSENRKLLVQVVIPIAGGGAPLEAVHDIYPNHVQLTSEYLADTSMGKRSTV